MTGGEATVKYDASSKHLQDHDSIRDVDEVFRYEWLPAESPTANGVIVESEVFYALP